MPAHDKSVKPLGSVQRFNCIESRTANTPEPISWVDLISSPVEWELWNGSMPRQWTEHGDARAASRVDVREGARGVVRASAKHSSAERGEGLC